MSSCDTTSGSCETNQASSCGTPSQNCCPCGGPCGGDPIACSMYLWKGSFFEAMKEVQTEILKAKIQKAWGPKMEKAADAVLEAMGTKWQSMLAESQAKTTLRSKLQSIFQEGK